MHLRYRPEILYFNSPFRIAHGTRDSTPVVFTFIDHDGLTGYGEAAMPPYLHEDQETCCAFLDKAAGLLGTISTFNDPGEIIQLIDALAYGNTAAKASVDIALHDLFGKMQKKPCWELFGAKKENAPVTTFTIAKGSEEETLQKLKDSETFPLLKIKLDGNDDREFISFIRKNTQKPLSVDVNQGWKSRRDAAVMIDWLARQNVLFVEQPLPRDNYEDERWLYQRTALPIYADESVQRLRDITLIKDNFHGVNIKLMKCGGLHEARKMITAAREQHLKVMIGCMSESSCGVSAAAQLSPLADIADLDGPLLIKNDFYKGITFREGKIILSERAGIGVVER